MAETREEALAALVKWLREAQVACEWQAPTPQMLSAQIADRIETALALPATADRSNAPPKKGASMNKWEEAALNSDQASYVRSLEAIPPEQRCYCGWYRLGECPHCPAGKTCADKLRDRGNDRVSSVRQCNDAPAAPSAEPSEREQVIAWLKSQYWLGCGDRKEWLIGELLNLCAAVRARPTESMEEIAKLANFILQEIPGEPSASEGAVDVAIRLLRERARPTLTAEDISHANIRCRHDRYFCEDCIADRLNAILAAKAGKDVKLTLTAEALAREFHETYERLAPQFGYETRKESARPWVEIPENHRNLMIAVCRFILTI